MAQHSLNPKDYSVSLHQSIAVILGLFAFGCSILLLQQHLATHRQQHLSPASTYQAEPRN